MFESSLKAKDLLEKNFAKIETGSTVQEALEEFKDNEYGKRSIYYVYIVEDMDLKGVVSVNTLLQEDSNTPVSKVMDKDLVTVDHDESAEKVARKMANTDFQALPILLKEEFVGVVRLDEMLEVLDSEATEDIFKKAGLTVEKEKFPDKSMMDKSVFDRVEIRLPWLIFALLGGIVAGSVIQHFEQSLQTIIALAFFIPVIMDMGGNVGTQSSTIFVRGLTLGKISNKDFYKRLLNEGVIGLLIGIIMGLLAAIYAVLIYSNYALGGVLIVSMVLTCVFASAIGFIIPWAAFKAGYDPAAVSDPLVTTLKDITALVIYFSSASLLIGL